MTITYTETDRRPVENWLAAIIYNTKAQLRTAHDDLAKATTEVAKARVEIAELEQRLVDFHAAQEELGFTP